MGRECVYDTGKPVSKVKQLEEKVAELQEMLMLQNQGLARTGGKEGSGNGNGNGQGQNQGQMRPPPVPVQGGTNGGSNGSGEIPLQGQTPVVHDSLASLTTFSLTNNGSASSGLPFAATSASGFPAMSGSSLDQQLPSNLSSDLPSQSYIYTRSGEAISTADNVRFHGASPNQQDPFSFSISSIPVNPGAMAQAPKAPIQFDFATLDPSFMSLVNQFGAASTSDPSGSTVGQQQQDQQGRGDANMAFDMEFATNNFPSPNTLNMMDTPAIFEAFTNANNGFFAGSPMINAQPTTGNQQSFGQAMGTAGSGTDASFLPLQGNGMLGTGLEGIISGTADPSPLYQQSDPYQQQGNGSRQGSGSLGSTPNDRDPRAATVSETDDFGLGSSSVPASAFGASASAQVGTTGAHLPGQDLVDGSSPIWRRDPVRPTTGTTSSSARGSVSGPGKSSNIAVNIHSAHGYTPRSTGSTSGQTSRSAGMYVSDAWKKNPEMEGLPLVGGWFDAADLPAVARDHLSVVFCYEYRCIEEDKLISSDSTYFSAGPKCLDKNFMSLVFTLGKLGSSNPPATIWTIQDIVPTAIC